MTSGIAPASGVADNLSTEWTADLARFVHGLEFNEIPVEVTTLATMHVADTIAVTVAGLRSALWPPLRALADHADAGTTGRIVGTDLKSATPTAALINGTLAHADDYDDDDPLLMVGHPSAPVVSALAALVDQTRMSGADLITSYVAGVEIEMRLGAGMNPVHYDHGWHATSTLGVLGAAAASARVLRLTEAQTKAAIGIAASLAGGLKANFGSMTKPLHTGAAARDGVLAATLASNGFTSSPDALEHPQGFVAVFGSKPVEQVGAELREMGRTWSLLDPGLAVKLYPSCSNTHPAIDAMLALRAEHGFGVADIVAIDCEVSPGTEKILIHPRPTTALQAKFSMQYCLAVAAATGSVRLDDFTAEAVSRREIRSLSEKVRVRPEPSIVRTAYGVSTASRLTVELVDGRTLQQGADCPRGSLEHPLTAEQRWEKFTDCLGSGRQEQASPAYRLWSDIATAPDVSVALDAVGGGIA